MPSERDVDARKARRIALIGICASACLATLNIVVGLLSRSTSVVATGVEFAGDVLASSAVFLGMTVAVVFTPASPGHAPLRRLDPAASARRPTLRGRGPSPRRC